MITAYDYSFARLVDKADLDIILVGDSLGMVVLGYDNTVPVTLTDMIHHCRAVSKGSEKAFLVGDMPFVNFHLFSRIQFQIKSTFNQKFIGRYLFLLKK